MFHCIPTGIMEPEVLLSPALLTADAKKPVKSPGTENFAGPERQGRRKCYNIHKDE